MDSNLFKVVYTGQLIDGFAVETVVAQFAEKFKLPLAKAEKVIRSKKPVVLKPRAEHDKAYQLKSALEAMGLDIKLERAALAEPKTAVKETERTEPVESYNNTSEESSADSDKAVSKDTAMQTSNKLDNAAWSLEPMTKEEPEEPVEESSVESEAFSKQAEPSSQSENNVKTKSNNKPPTGDKQAVGGLIKTIGAWVVGIVAAGFVVIKKFGLFKFLKIGGLMTAAAFAGYESDEICMGNAACEDAIDEQVDDCWERSGLDDYDWDNMSDEAYFSLKPKVEQDFIACFVYEDTGERVLMSPLDLRFDLIDNCLWTENESCLRMAEAQFKSCYVANEIEYLVSANTLDFYQVVSDNQQDFKNYYSCFLDEAGAPLFDIILQNWDELYEE